MTVNGDYQTLAVCTDCYQAAANGVDDPYADFPAGFVEAFADSVRAWGGIPDPVTVDQDGNPIEGAFSWGGCPWCGSTLGGDRWPVIVPTPAEDSFSGLVARLVPFLGDERHGIRTTTTQVKLGVSALREIVTLLETHVGPDRGPVTVPTAAEDDAVRCCECGGVCDAADSVADDSGLAWCGSVYGNGCADRRGQ